jgi:hypothetical protein
MTWFDYESVIYTIVLLSVYLIGMAVSILLLDMSIPIFIALQQLALVSISIPLGLFLVRRFRRTLYSLAGVISNTSVVPIGGGVGGVGGSASDFLAEGLEIFTGEPNF